MELLKIGLGGNAKLDKNIATFSILSGHSCPGADKCYTKVIIDKNNKRKIVDGKNQKFRCFSASQEALYNNVYSSRLHNYNLILNIVRTKSLIQDTVYEIYRLFELSLPKLDKWSILRLHVGGDIFCQEYFDALIMLASQHPDKIFYAYTKSIHFWVKRLDKIPDNFKLTASYGGKYDHLIDEYNLKSVKVIMSEEEAEMYNLEIDHDDSHAYNGDDNFALLLHGSQPKGSNAAKAKIELAKTGWTGYSNVNNKSKKDKNMLNLVQYQDLKLYLISLLLNISDIKNIKSKDENGYIEYKQNGIIYDNIKILDAITFEYEDLVYNCFKVNQQSGNKTTKWICNCDSSVEIYEIYDNIKVYEQPIIPIDNIYELDESHKDIINSYNITFHNDTITLDKIYNLGTKKVYYDVDKQLILATSFDENKHSDFFVKKCKQIGISPKPLLTKINNTQFDSNRVKISKYSIDYFSNNISNPEYNINDIVIYNDVVCRIIDIGWNNDDKQWNYYLYDDEHKNNFTAISSLSLKRVDNNQILSNHIQFNTDDTFREKKDNKIRPDLISPYFLESIGRLMRDNNDKYPEYNYINLSDSSFFQSMWRHIIAYSEQRLSGVSKEFNDNEDHLAAIAFNVMGLIHNRETK